MTDVATTIDQIRPPVERPEVEAEAYAVPLGDSAARLNLMVDGVHCANCIRKIETSLHAEPGVTDARVNLSTRRMTVDWDPQRNSAGRLIDVVRDLGFEPMPFDPDLLASRDAAANHQLLKALAVAGFATANVMLLSVSVWAGAFSDMTDSTRHLMHWVSALIALPAIAYAGQPFFRSALAAISAKRVNMDVPISVALVTTAAISLAETIIGGPHAYFDAAVMLLFFLLIGRFLDSRTRGAVRSTAENLVALAAQPATVVKSDGTRELVPSGSVAAGSTVLVAAGARVPVDGVLMSGAAQLDNAFLTGESVPVSAANGETVYAGALNAGDALTLRATATGERTVLADIVRLVEAAGQHKSAHVRLADRAARLYAPLVHSLALFTFLGWVFLGGMDAHQALLIAVAVLIITCPCALGLAVPAVQVAASGRLMKSGVLVKSGDALERLAEIDHVVLDKTGTLTRGQPTLSNIDEIPAEALSAAASLAATSDHPLCRALLAAAGTVSVASNVREERGMGLEAEIEGTEWRLGNKAWCGIDTVAAASEGAPGSELWLTRSGHAPVRFEFSDPPRSDAESFVRDLAARGFEVELLSGDRVPAVQALADDLGIANWRAEVRPEDKLAHMQALSDAGRRVLMVGDGLNDAPALARAHASISPASGADLSQNAADVVFQSEKLAPVLEAIDVAGRARQLVKQNFALATGYNILAVPLAIAGLVTPLIAAAAMSASSILVTANALRLGVRK